MSLMSVASETSARGGVRREVITKFLFYFIPLILIASHPPPSSPILHLCLLNSLTVHAQGRDDEMGELLERGGVKNHGEQGDAGGSANFSLG